MFVLSGRLGLLHRLEFYCETVEFEENGLAKSDQCVTRLSQLIPSNKNQILFW